MLGKKDSILKSEKGTFSQAEISLRKKNSLNIAKVISLFFLFKVVISQVIFSVFIGWWNIFFKCYAVYKV